MPLAIRQTIGLLLLVVTAGFNCLLANAEDPAARFRDYYELEPFVVTGEDIPITVFARTNADRNYATRFAHKVVEVAYYTIEKSPGSGLVIIGRSGEPHPIHLIENFMERARSEDASPELRVIADELDKAVDEWREKIRFDVDTEEDNEIPVDLDKLVVAFPMPLPKIAADLYLLAWQEDFDAKRIDQKLDSLTIDDLRQQDFEEFKWVFYLPPRNTLNGVLKEVLPAAFEAAEMGFFKRAMARTAIAAFKPLIRDAMEGVRKGVMYWAVLNANSELFGEGDIDLLAEAYIESQMPRGKIIGGGKKERALEATQAQILKNAEYAKDPFTLPEPIESYDLTLAESLLGTYGDEGHRDKRFFIQEQSLFWQEGDDEPIEYLPAGETLFVSSEKDITIEFIPGETDDYTRVELRKGRFRHTFSRKSES